MAFLVIFTSYGMGATILDFKSGNSSGGIVSYVGSSAPLVGSAIGIGSFSATGTTPSGNYFVRNSNNTGYGQLDFTTGSFVSFSGGIYTFSNGGTLTIQGSIWTIGSGGGWDTQVVAYATLLTANFVGGIYNTNTNTIDLETLQGTDTKDPTLLRYFGLPTNTPFAFTASIDTNKISPGGGAFSTGAAQSTDVANGPIIPEPATLSLLGAGLLALCALGRRRSI
jgi:hypothetical protein